MLVSFPSVLLRKDVDHLCWRLVLHKGTKMPNRHVLIEYFPRSELKDDNSLDLDYNTQLAK